MPPRIRCGPQKDPSVKVDQQTFDRVMKYMRS